MTLPRTKAVHVLGSGRKEDLSTKEQVVHVILAKYNRGRFGERSSCPGRKVDAIRKKAVHVLVEKKSSPMRKKQFISWQKSIHVHSGKAVHVLVEM